MTPTNRHITARLAALPLLFALGALTTCESTTPDMAENHVATRAGPENITAGAGATGRINGRITPERRTGSEPIVREIGRGATIGEAHPTAGGPPIVTGSDGDVTLNYVDTDIREIARQILGTILKLNYTIEPGFQGMATIQTSHPLKREELLPTFQTLLSQAGGSMVYQNGLFRIGPAGDDTVVPPIVDAASAGVGSQVISLRYASAKQLAAMLKPYVGEGGKIIDDPSRNVLIVSGSPATRTSLIDLVRVFDVDYLAGQSYALYPVKSGEPDKVATELQHALGADNDSAAAGALSIIPIEQANAIMVIAKQPAYLDRARRFMDQIDYIADTTGRSLHVYFLKNVQAKELQPVLQRAINPGGATEAAEAAPGNLPPTSQSTQVSSATPGGAATPGGGTTPTATGMQSTLGAAQGTQGSVQPSVNSMASTIGPASDSELGQDLLGAGGNASKGPQIIADPQGNALIIVATEAEYEKIEAAIRRLDIMPMQVLIEATVAEVTLNDNLQYGTQFFLRNGKMSGILTNAESSSTTATPNTLTNGQLFSGTLAPNFPGLAIARTFGSAQFALEALKAVTQVRVLSSPKLLILDRQQATLQVGDLVPIITQSATNVVTSNAAIVNNVQYQPTGVILTVTPRINSGGLVTLDIDQEVSQVVPTTSSTINSPTFQQRKVNSRVVVQDGDTISLAGLIQDNKNIGNSGIPVLKDIPVLGHLFSTQDNTTTRTELLVLIAPHVVYDQQGARALTDELRRKLPGSATLAEPQ